MTATSWHVCSQSRSITHLLASSTGVLVKHLLAVRVRENLKGLEVEKEALLYIYVVVDKNCFLEHRSPELHAGDFWEYITVLFSKISSDACIIHWPFSSQSRYDQLRPSVPSLCSPLGPVDGSFSLLTHLWVAFSLFLGTLLTVRMALT